MSNEVKKPTVTKARPIEKDSKEDKKGFFSYKKKPKKPSQISSSKLVLPKVFDTNKQKLSKVKKPTQLPRSRTTKQIKTTRKKRQSTSRVKNNKTIFIGLVVALIGFAGYRSIYKRNTNLGGFISSTQSETGLLEARDTSANDAPFTTVTPNTVEGRLKTKFDSEKGFYSFQEEVSNKVITVSQTAVPNNYTLDVQLLLQNTEYSSAFPIKTNKGNTYVLTLEGSLLQQAFFKYKNSLVSVYATEGLPNNVWIEYINSL